MFTLKFTSRMLIVATVALLLGIASSAQASEPFLAVFVDALQSGQLKHDSTGPTQYQDSATGGIIPTEMVSMSLTSHGDPVTVPPGGSSFAVDSFFDIFYEIDFEVDSFFDVFTELRVTPGEQTETVGTFATEILSMDLSSSPDPPELQGPVIVRIDPSRMSTGHVTVLKRGDSTYQVDSFFDVFTELTLDDGTTWNPSLGPTPLQGSINVVPEPSTLALLVCAGMALALLRVRRTKADSS